MMAAESKVLTIAIEAAGAVPQTNDRPLSDGLGAARLLLDKGAQNFAVPTLRMFDVENGMQSEVKAFLCWNAKPLQASIDKTCSCGRRHFDDAEGTD
jgi:hypothetical protein